MNWTEFFNHILGDLTPAFILAFYVFAAIGMLFSLLIHYYRKSRRERKKGTPIKFEPIFWITNNLVRFAANLIAIFLVVRFHKELPIEKELNMFLGVVIGLSIDVVVLYLAKIKLNIGTKSKI